MLLGIVSVDLGLADNGVYTIAVRATNDDGLYSTTAFTNVQINDTPPTVGITGARIADGRNALHHRLHGDGSIAEGRVLEWRVDWGDGPTSKLRRQRDRRAMSMPRRECRDRVMRSTRTPARRERRPPLCGDDRCHGHKSYGRSLPHAKGESLTLTADATGSPSCYSWVINNEAHDNSHPTVSLPGANCRRSASMTAPAIATRKWSRLCDDRLGDADDVLQGGRRDGRQRGADVRILREAAR